MLYFFRKLIAANLFLVGYAFQKGLLPVSLQALQKAIELNGVEVEFNIKALEWGRRAAFDLETVTLLCSPKEPSAITQFDGPQFIARRVKDLEAYQNAGYARRYEKFIKKAALAEVAVAPNSNCEFSVAVSKAYYKLLAIKDEYEVARLHSDGRFRSALNEAFENGSKIKFHLAPPLFSKKDPVTGHPVKHEYGPWIMPVLSLLARLRVIRGTALDFFNKTPERRREQQDILDYETLITSVNTRLTKANYDTAVELAKLPLYLRGFGHIKDQAREKMLGKKIELMQLGFPIRTN